MNFTKLQVCIVLFLFSDVDLDNVSVKVLFIDEGNTAVVSLSSLRPLEKKFSLIPSQSFHCILGGIQPIDASKKYINPNFGNKKS